jgi:peptidoglycan/xylan/chitin deacetylase (PgdA/CDA1 family)
MNKITALTLTILTSAFLMTSCSGLAVAGKKSAATTQTKQEVKKDSKETIDLTKKPNESGKIMVLMYHNIGSTEKEWVRTPENFKKDMQTLYEKGYRPISLTDYVTGNIATEAGCTPVVITFDDGNGNNFEYLSDGTISKTSAVGLLLDFHEQHKDFPLEATFFLNDGPFGQKGMESKKVSFIVEKGMDIGNHTAGHSNLTGITADKIQKEIGSQAQYLEKLISKEGYVVNTIALPFGSRPKDDSLATYLQAGSFNGVAYKNIAILNVGWNPAYSPYDTKFNNLSIPRVRASEMKVENVGMYNYIQYFDNHPEEKFVSDGVSGIVTVPAAKAEKVKASTGKELYTY